MVYPRFSYIIWTRKNSISFKSNNKQASKWRKNLKTAFLHQCTLELLYYEYDCLVGQPRREGAETGREEALMNNICLISHYWYMWRNLLYLAVVFYLKLCFYKLSTGNSCFTTWLFTRFLFMVTEILRKVVLFCHHSKT